MNWNNVPDEETIIKIFKDINENNMTLSKVVEKYGISRHLASNIRFMRIPWLKEIADKYNLVPKSKDMKRYE